MSGRGYSQGYLCNDIKYLATFPYSKNENRKVALLKMIVQIEGG